MPLSAHADSLFDTLIYRSLSRSHHAVPAPGENRPRDRVVRATGEDDAEEAGGAADATDGAGPPHPRFPGPGPAPCRGGTEGSPGTEDPTTPRRAPGDRSENGTEALRTPAGI